MNFLIKSFKYFLPIVLIIGISNTTFAASNPLVLQMLRETNDAFITPPKLEVTSFDVSNIPTEPSAPIEEPTEHPNIAYPIKISNDAKNEHSFDYADNWELIRINEVICDKSPTSRLCDNGYLQKKLSSISDKRGVPFWIMVGLAQAESQMGTTYAGGCDASYNNWGGVKYRRLDSGKVLGDYPIPDDNGCWVYKFNSIEDYWKTTSNIIRMGYLDKGCEGEADVARCISECYVGGCGSGEEENWILAVNQFSPVPVFPPVKEEIEVPYDSIFNFNDVDLSFGNDADAELERLRKKYGSDYEAEFSIE